MKHPPIQDPGNIRNEEEALNQSIALNRIVMAMLQQQKDSNKRMFVALIVSLVINAIIFCGFLYYESQWEYSTETTYTTTTTEDVDQNIEGEGSAINNVEGNQYNDSSTHNEGGTD